MDQTAGGGIAPESAQERHPHEWEVRMQMVQAMLAAFRFERFAYLILSLIACVVLLGASIWLFMAKEKVAAFAIFGSSGVLTLTLSRMLRMWDQAWKLVAGGDK